MHDDKNRNPEQPLSEQSSALFVHELTRRDFVMDVGILTASAYLALPPQSGGTTLIEASRDTSSELVKLNFRVNGQPKSLAIDPRVTLLDLLRENLGLTGSKKGCDHGQCGACTVLANGRRINSCLSLAVVHEGDEITTVEGLARGGELHPLQAAFIEEDGYQCGYCTPGQLCSAAALFEEHKRGDRSFVTKDLGSRTPVELTAEEIRERMSGNICRCGAYPGIVRAMQRLEEKRGK
jgi:xanthine dehydrogenase YagT iron-sulfur-binding subunit